ncbi:hypothetical protein LMG3412_05381 [Achromobacter deleyi]|nr:hypothetical protein LMG3412_05381 [Achromobacter deleyi]
MADDHIQRAIGVVLQRIAVAQRVAVQRVGDRHALAVVRRQRPQRTGRGQLSAGEMQGVAVRAFQRPALAVGGQQQHGQVFGQACARLRLGRQGTPQIGVAVDARAGGFALPAVDAAQRDARGRLHAVARGAQTAAQALLDRVVLLVEIERPAGYQADPAQLGQHRLIGGVRRVLAQQLGGVSEEGIGRHRLDLLAHRNLQIQGRVRLDSLRLRRQVPLGQRRHGKGVLQGVDGRIVGGAIGLDQVLGPHIGGRGVDARHAGRQRAGPARRHESGVAACCAGAALAQRGKGLVPHVQQGQGVEPAMCVGGGQHHGAGRQVQPGGAAQHVRVGPRRGGARPGQGALVQEGVGGRAQGALRRMGELAPRQVHGDQRIEVQIAFHRRVMGGLGGGSGRRQGGRGQDGGGAQAQGRQGKGGVEQGRPGQSHARQRRQRQGQGGKAAHRRSNRRAGIRRKRRAGTRRRQW